MPRIQQSVEVNLPVHVIYNQLTRFEDYPRFMRDVELVQQLDDTHLHWKAKMADRDMEWDAEITEQIPDQCIAWHNMSGPKNAGRIEVQPAGADTSRVTMTMDAEQGQVPGSSAGGGDNEMSQRLADNLTRLKEFIETRGSETGEWRGEIHDAQATGADGDPVGKPSTDDR
ncbi:SRPBCC family protein [Noviherbaspirillum sp.]|uniref:SRPBCC family protein n=1 Tax=Noviherbaspirillum sp. TaxID=1926288 RepID=UPI002FE2D532